MFESVGEFLKNEAGSHVQKEALYLLYLLLNCKLLFISFFFLSFGQKKETEVAHPPAQLGVRDHGSSPYVFWRTYSKS